ncbi:MAG TPA: hypothetical protein VGC02_04350 [Methanobacterium sp.]
MNCQNCGGYIKRRDTYCPHCGVKLARSNYKPRQVGKNSEFKPLQQRYMRGEYQDREEDFYNQYVENQYKEDGYIEERPAYNKPKKKKYRGYDLSEYYPDEEETESSGIGMTPIILILVIALLIGFIIGIIMFTSSSLTMG